MLPQARPPSEEAYRVRPVIEHYTDRDGSQQAYRPYPCKHNAWVAYASGPNANSALRSATIYPLQHCQRLARTAFPGPACCVLQATLAQISA